jgi:hypothetical protein
VRRARDDQKADKGVGQRLSGHVNGVVLEPGGNLLMRRPFVHDPECYPFQLFVAGLQPAAVLAEEQGSRRDRRAPATVYKWMTLRQRLNQDD